MSNQPKNYWQRRLIKRKESLPDGSIIEFFGIYEVYFIDGKPSLIPQDPEPVCGESIQEIQDFMYDSMEAMRMPILSYEELDQLSRDTVESLLSDKSDLDFLKEKLKNLSCEDLGKEVDDL